MPLTFVYISEVRGQITPHSNDDNILKFLSCMIHIIKHPFHIWYSVCAVKLILLMCWFDVVFCFADFGTSMRELGYARPFLTSLLSNCTLILATYFVFSPKHRALRRVDGPNFSSLPYSLHM